MILYKYFTHKGNIRIENQDYYGHLELGKCNLFIVCDGMGGAQGGATASRLCVDVMKESFQVTDDRIYDIKYSIKCGNTAVYEKAGSSPDYFGMGTTVCAVYLDNDEYFSCWVGDSRIYHLKGQEILWRSRDHSQLNHFLDQGMSPDEAQRMAKPNMIMRAVGTKSNVDVDGYGSVLGMGEKLLISSDGLHGFLAEEEIVDTIASNGIDVAGEKLMSRVLSSEINAPDNVTFCIIEKV